MCLEKSVGILIPINQSKLILVIKKILKHLGITLRAATL